jgi:hypothetical protein
VGLVEHRFHEAVEVAKGHDELQRQVDEAQRHVVAVDVEERQPVGRELFQLGVGGQRRDVRPRHQPDRDVHGLGDPADRLRLGGETAEQRAAGAVLHVHVDFDRAGAMLGGRDGELDFVTGQADDQFHGSNLKLYA